ncbi:RIKEN cDNA 2410004B18, isoform CRA_b [Mus musculus]|nr:RIKEN cDNA 2410004B18, isoform CRA_b [Mus musculus]
MLMEKKKCLLSLKDFKKERKRKVSQNDEQGGACARIHRGNLGSSQGFLMCLLDSLQRSSRSGSPTACRPQRPTLLRRSRRRQSWTWRSNGRISMKTMETMPHRTPRKPGFCLKGRRQWNQRTKKALFFPSSR